MDGTAELLQLAHLLRVGANTARDIAALRKLNASEICSLADQAEIMASDLESIVKKPQVNGHSPLANTGI